MTTYYVSSIVGSDNNAGTSASAPLASLQAAADLVKPGDTVEVMNGTYVGNAPGGGDVLDIATSGTASAPITFEAAPGQTPVINSSGGWNAIDVTASYIVVKGFTVEGDAANYTLAQATAGYSGGDANLDGNGIYVTGTSGGYVPNHVTIENNTVYNEPGGGIGTQYADYVNILNNTVYDNAHWSAYGNSGISINVSSNSDTNPGVHDVVSGNTVYGNAQEVPTIGGNTITDGEGIILDTNPGFVGEMLVENNTVYDNGSAGIESFLTDGAVITGNTLYGNNTGNLLPANDAQIFINQSNNNTVTNNTIGDNSVAPTVAITSAGGTVSSAAQTIAGTVDVADAGSEVTILDGTTPIGTGMVDANGNWSANVTLINQGANVLTATDTNASGTGTSKAITDTLSSNAALTNGNFATGTFSGWTLGSNDTSGQIFIDTNAEGGSTYAAGMGSTGSDGTLSQTVATTAGQTYTLSFWLQNEASGGNDFTATWNGQALLSLTNAAQSGYTQYTYTVTAAGSSSTLEFSAMNAGSQWDLDNVSLTANGTVSASPPAAPVISTGEANSNDSVTLTGTAPSGSTVTVSDGGATALGVATASSTGAWSFTTADLAAGSYAFTATDATSSGTSAASKAFDVTVASSSPPAAPVISTGVANSNDSVTLTGAAPSGSTVTVSDGGATALGVATASSTGAWSFTTADLAAGSYAFTATDATSSGTSAASKAFDVTVASSSPPASGSNLVANGNFGTGSLSGWTLGGNSIWQGAQPEIFIDTNAEGGSKYAAGMGSMGSDGTLSQTIATTAGKTYTVSFWLQNEASDGNDFTATWNGQTLLSLTNAAQSGYTQYTYTVTATGNSSTLEFSAQNNPSQWDLDNVSVVDPPTTSATANATSVTGISDSPAKDALNAGKTIDYRSGFGHESITGLLAGGSSHDVIELPLTMSKGLSSTNTASQNWNALLSGGAAVQSGANVTITDAAHDILTLNNVTTSMLHHDASNVFKFV
jgi:hypothetical protein